MTDGEGSRRGQLSRRGVLLVLRHAPGAAAASTSEGDELFLAVGDSGQVFAYSGHVDLGTGIGTALAQIVADELDVAFDRVTMVLGHSRDTPNQGATIASETIQVSAVPLRCAAAQARAHLLALAAERLGVDAADLVADSGVFGVRGTNRHVPYAALVAGQHIRLALDETVAVKAVADHRIVGQPVPRTDIPAKATARFVYVHDVRVPGMLHGRVVRPPYAGLDQGDFVGRSLLGVDRSSVADIPGLVAVVTLGDFVGVVATREEDAARAAETLVVRWRAFGPTPDLTDPEQALRAHPSTPRVLLDRGDVEGALARAATPLRRRYLWPSQMHGAIGPSCAVADVGDAAVTVWSGTQNPLPLRADLARLLDRAEAEIAVVRHEAAGCYGRNGADDVTADAALLSRAVGRPVRVQLTRAQEHLWEPKGAAQLMEVDGGLDADGAPLAYDFSTRYPSNAAPILALLLTGALAPAPVASTMGDRNAVPPYAYPNARIVVHDMAPIVRASWLRGVSALPNSFAHESYIDELATAAAADPIAYRLRYLDDPRAAAMIRSVAERAAWTPHDRPQTLAPAGDWLRGRGFAYAPYVHGTFPGTAAASAAWIADVSVHRATGEVAVTRVVVGQDAGLMINPAGVEHQLHGNVVQATSRALMEEVAFADGLVASRDWGAYPILRFDQLPAIDVVMMARPHDPPLGVGESASVPSAAAIANAIFDATGIRFREPPFTPERVRAALHPLAAPAAVPVPATRRWRRPRVNLGWLVGAAGAAAGLAALILPMHAAIPAIPRPDPGVFAAMTLARGRVAAAVGDCAVCHGADYAGGRAIATPFGDVIATNISPDVATGIGGWSYPAFERAMREGVSRDGHNLYPAHPYPSFTRTADADLQALYAHLMAQPAVSHTPSVTALAAPFGERRLMRVWNALYLRAGPLPDEPSRSAAWNRGRALVEGLGHCSACHAPRSMLGAERGGFERRLGGAVEGWDAPALAGGTAPVPWTEEALFTYLSTGHHPRHGVAGGPMAEVVTQLATLPDNDRRAMAHYLATLAPATSEDAATARAEALRAAASRPVLDHPAGARLYAGACAVCHEPDGPTLFGVRPDLAVNTSLHAARPDNLIRVILDGIMAPALPELGTMPGFAPVYSDAQLADLLRYLRARFAPEAAPWPAIEQAVGRIRAARR